MNKIIARVNPKDPVYVDFYQQKKGNESWDYLWTVHQDSLDPIIPWDLWNDTKEIEVEIMQSG